MVLFRKILVVVALLGLGAIIPYVAYHDDSTDLLQPTETPVADNPVVQKFIDDYTDACVNGDYQSYLDLIHPKVRKQYEDEWIKYGDSQVNVLYFQFCQEGRDILGSWMNPRTYYVRKPSNTLTYRILSSDHYYGVLYKLSPYSSMAPTFSIYDAERKYGIDAKYFKTLTTKISYVTVSKHNSFVSDQLNVVCIGKHLYRSFSTNLIENVEELVARLLPQEESPKVSKELCLKGKLMFLPLIRGALNKDPDVLKKMVYPRNKVMIDKEFPSFYQKEMEVIYRWFRHVGSADNLKDIKCDYQEYFLPASAYFPELLDKYPEGHMPDLNILRVRVKRLICRDGLKPADISLYFAIEDDKVSLILTKYDIEVSVNPDIRRTRALKRITQLYQDIRDISLEFGEIAAKEWLEKNPEFSGTREEWNEVGNLRFTLSHKYMNKAHEKYGCYLDTFDFGEGFLNALKKQFPDKSGK